MQHTNVQENVETIIFMMNGSQIVCLAYPMYLVYQLFPFLVRVMNRKGKTGKITDAYKHYFFLTFSVNFTGDFFLCDIYASLCLHIGCFSTSATNIKR